jgi:Family of unknown function (DUF5691)
MVMNAWETLVASALVGTNRHSPSIDLTHPALTDYGTALPSQSPIQQILSAAGLIAAYQSVGNSPSPATSPLLAPAAANELPCCSPLTARHLSSILNESRYEPILPELLQLLAQARQTVPPDFLPLVLERGKRNKSLRSLITPMLGSRGQWLVRQNPEWEYALGGAISSLDLAQLPEIWATGTRSERLAALTQWRQIQPAEARQAVAASWKQDKADDRQAWLEVLETNLSLEDEEFLEVALFDRNESVSKKAIDLLSQIPSQYRQQLTHLAQECIKIEDLNGEYKITIQPPDVDSQDWQVPGINNKLTDRNSVNGLSINEWYLLQALSVASLEIWTGDVSKLVLAMSRTKRSIVAIVGWARAACRQQRNNWIEALLSQANSTLFTPEVSQLLQSLPESAIDQKEQFFSRLLADDNFIDTFIINLKMMIDIHKIWTPRFTDLVLDRMDKYAQSIDRPNLSTGHQYHIQDILPDTSRNMDISVLVAMHKLEEVSSSKNMSYGKCIEILEFRREMQAAFNSA